MPAKTDDQFTYCSAILLVSDAAAEGKDAAATPRVEDATPAATPRVEDETPAATPRVDADEEEAAAAE